MVVLGLFWRDAIDQMIEVQFNLVERGNAVVTFPHPLDRTVIGDLAREPGVLVAEGHRDRAGAPARRASQLSDVGDRPAVQRELRRPHDAALRPIDVPPDGITLTRRLAERLEVVPGDIVTIEVMEGRRRKIDLPVSAIVDEVIGMSSYMEIDTLNRLTGEGAVVSAAALFVEPSALAGPVAAIQGAAGHRVGGHEGLHAELVPRQDRRPRSRQRRHSHGVCGDRRGRRGLQQRPDRAAGARLGTRQPARARLHPRRGGADPVQSVRRRDRVGDSDRALALARHRHADRPISFQRELSRFREWSGARTYVVAVAIVVAAAAASAYVVRRRIDRLDLVAVLKTRD